MPAASVAKQANCLPNHGQKCQTKAAEKRHHRTPETLQATINGRAKQPQPKHKKDRRDRCATGNLLAIHLCVDETDQATPLVNTHGGNGSASGEHRGIAPARSLPERQRSKGAHNQDKANGALQQGLQAVIGQGDQRMVLVGHAPDPPLPFPGPEVSSSCILVSLLAASATRIEYTSPEAPPKTIPVTAIHD